MSSEPFKNKLRHIVNNLINIREKLTIDGDDSELINEVTKMINIGEFLLTKDDIVVTNEYLEGLTTLKSLIVANRSSREELAKKASDAIDRLDALLRDAYSDYQGSITTYDNNSHESSTRVDKIKSRIDNLNKQFDIVEKFIQYNEKNMSREVHDTYTCMINQYRRFSQMVNIGSSIGNSEYILIQRIFSASFSCIVSLKDIDKDNIKKPLDLASSLTSLVNEYAKLKGIDTKTI